MNLFESNSESKNKKIGKVFMFFRKNKTILLGLTLILSLVIPNLAQKTGDGTISQRLEIMRQKLDTMRKSLANAISTLKDDAKEVKDDKSKKDNKSNLDTPLGRLQSLDK